MTPSDNFRLVARERVFNNCINVPPSLYSREEELRALFELLYSHTFGGTTVKLGVGYFERFEFFVRLFRILRISESHNFQKRQ